MIIVLLLFFQSICRFCQRIVLHIHDRWINPKNVRLLSEAAESAGNKIAHGKRNSRREITATTSEHNCRRLKRVPRKRYTNCVAYNKTSEQNFENNSVDLMTVASGGLNGFVETTCRFCANTPQGYCRHHLHLQELQVQQQQQQQQQRFWNPLAVQPNIAQEYRQLRKINRELRCTLKNRLSAQGQIQQRLNSYLYNNNKRSVTTSPIHSANTAQEDTSATRTSATGNKFSQTNNYPITTTINIYSTQQAESF